jgi:hypothetical protein
MANALVYLHASCAAADSETLKPYHLTLRRAPLEYLGVNSAPVSIARGHPRAIETALRASSG